jgi:hypothetical protein
MEAFGVNIATASTDIKRYKENGGILIYDLSNRCYVKPTGE